MLSVTQSHPVHKGNTKKRDMKLVRNKTRSWCWTLNNYTKEDIVILSQPK